MSNVFLKSGYGWKNGFRHTSIDANAVGAVLEELQDEEGVISVRAIWQDGAASADSPLHSYFEWNDKTAADLHRDEQASYILRHLVPVYVDLRSEEEVQGERSYIPVSVARPSDHDRAKHYIMVNPTEAPIPPKEPQKTDREMKAWIALMEFCDKYGDIPAYRGVIEAINALRP